MHPDSVDALSLTAANFEGRVRARRPSHD
jgi:hypothetical protein